MPETDCLSIQTGSDFSKLLPGGYFQTKWVAEQICQKYQTAGLPCVIYRLGNVGGNTETGMWNKQDTNLAFLKICSDIGAVPTYHLPTHTSEPLSSDYLIPPNGPMPRRGSFQLPITHMELSIEMTPVNFITDVICGGIAQIRKVSGQIVHLIQPKKTPLEHVVTAFDHLNSKMKRVDTETWNGMVAEKGYTDIESRRQFSL